MHWLRLKVMQRNHAANHFRHGTRDFRIGSIRVMPLAPDSIEMHLGVEGRLNLGGVPLNTIWRRELDTGSTWKPCDSCQFTTRSTSRSEAPNNPAKKSS